MIENEIIITTIKETVKEIALLLGGANVISVALITWLGKIWMDRIIESERRKTQVLVEEIKNSLTQEREQLNQVLKTQLDQSRFMFEKTISFLSDNQKVVGEKRFLAFEKLWKTVYELRRIAPFYLDTIKANEYEIIRTNKYFKSQLENIKDQEFISNYQNITLDFELLRIYIPSMIWSLYDAYRLMSLSEIRIKMSLDPKSNMSISPWYQVPNLRDIIVNLLNNEELNEFDGLLIGQLSWILNRIEVRLIDLLQRHISGDIALKEISEQTDLLDNANRKAQETLNPVFEIVRGDKI